MMTAVSTTPVDSSSSKEPSPQVARSNQKDRIWGLDVLRAIAVILVLFRHLPSIPTATPEWLRAVINTLQRGGWVGVDLFFVLSGFLVSSILFRQHAATGRSNAGRFLVRRMLKIYPSFFALLLVTVGALLWLGRPIPLGRLLAEAFFLQNFLPGIWSHTWTLAVEEHFYLLLAGFFLLLDHTRPTARVGFKVLPRLILGVCLACLILRWNHLWADPEDAGAVYRWTHYRVDAFAIGVLLAWWRHSQPAAFAGAVHHRATLLVIAGLVLIAPPFFTELRFDAHLLLTAGITSFAIGGGCLVAVAVTLPAPDAPPLRHVYTVLGKIGVYSYSIYLWHFPVRKLSPVIYANLFGSFPDPVTHVCLYLTGSLLIGISASRLIEWPVLRWRDRHFPRAGASRAEKKRLADQ